MDSLNTIPVSGNFGDISGTLNDNFGKLSQSLTTLENTRFDSAYSVYVETTLDNPVKTKEEWVDSLRTEVVIDKDQFAKNTSTSLPPSIYQDTVPTMSAGEYLWVRRYTEFTDGTVVTTIPRVTMGDVSALSKKTEITGYIEKSLTNYADFVNNLISGYTINSIGNPQASASWKMLEVNLNANFVPGDYIAISDFYYDSGLSYWAIFDKPYTDASRVSRGFGVLNSPDTIILNIYGGYLYMGVTNGSEVFDYSRMTVNKYIPDKRVAEHFDRIPVVADRVKSKNFTFELDPTAENKASTGTIVADGLINSKFEIQTPVAGWKYIDIPIPPGEENIFIAGLESPSTSGFFYRIVDSNNNFLQSGSLDKNTNNHIRILKKSARILFSVKAGTDTSDIVFSNLFVAFKGKITEVNGNKLGGNVNEWSDVVFNSVTASTIETDVLVLGNTPIWDEVSATTIVSGQIYLKQDGSNYILKVKG